MAPCRELTIPLKVTDRWKDGGLDKRLWDNTSSAWRFVSEGACLSASLHAEISEEKQAKTVKYVLMFTCANSSILCVYTYAFCGYSWVSFSLLHAGSPLPPAPVSERDLRIGAGPQGSCLDWISNQCYTSCVLASAIFNTQGEAPPGGKSQLSACVGSSMGDVITRVLGERLDSQKMDDGLSQCFNFKVIRYSWGGRECGINTKTGQDYQFSAAWSIQYVWV